MQTIPSEFSPALIALSTFILKDCTKRSSDGVVGSERDKVGACVQDLCARGLPGAGPGVCPLAIKVTISIHLSSCPGGAMD